MKWCGRLLKDTNYMLTRLSYLFNPNAVHHPSLKQSGVSYE